MGMNMMKKIFLFLTWMKGMKGILFLSPSSPSSMFNKKILSIHVSWK